MSPAPGFHFQHLQRSTLGRLKAELVRLRDSEHRRVKVPSWRSFPPETESNCVTARWSGEQLEVNRQPIERRVIDEPARQTRYGRMRLTRLRVMSEVRGTADSCPSESGAKPTRSKKHSRSGGAWGGWRLDVWKCKLGNQGYLSWCWKEQGRSQSPHSSEETGNDRGAKGGRKVEE
jgi:hypothetical protein